ncbi:CMRF35-like molecule 1 [Pygocentrus nattereri]|uniref:CMRF35-like molecule 1 n=1 Tax=Pygocentrus nattereri TaxID=42514 RepID=UPI001890CEDD|nr:CMRF35-like molecule 1 [Pygocentrus nattereri]
MRSLRVTIVMLLSVVSGMLHVEITETGKEGNIAVITCPYSKGYESYTKYFCKGGYTDCETLVKSNGNDSWTYTDRITMNDNTEQKKLVVTIRDLRMEDAGDYGCGIETIGRDPFTLVHLKVIKAPKPPKRTQSNPTRSSPPPPTVSTDKTGGNFCKSNSFL